MKASPQAAKLVQTFEGCKLIAYPDPASGGDPWTIGWGSTGPDIRRGLSWSQGQCDARLKVDLSAFSDKISVLIGNAPTSQHQFDALVSFAYNLGAGNLKTSTLLTLHRAGKFDDAANEFVKWDKAAGKEMKGLKIRRLTEAEVYKADGVDVQKMAQQIARGLV